MVESRTNCVGQLKSSGSPPSPVAVRGIEAAVGIGGFRVSECFSTAGDGRHNSAGTSGEFGSFCDVYHCRRGQAEAGEEGGHAQWYISLRRGAGLLHDSLDRQILRRRDCANQRSEGIALRTTRLRKAVEFHSASDAVSAVGSAALF